MEMLLRDVKVCDTLAELMHLDDCKACFPGQQKGPVQGTKHLQV